MFVLVIFGPPAAGKYTVGTEVARRTGLPLFHNHLTVNLCRVLFEFGTAPFIALRERLWLETFRVASQADTSLIFTFAPEATVSASFIEAVRDVLKSPNRVFFVELSCSMTEREARVDAEGRRQLEKLSSREEYRALVQKGALEYSGALAPDLRIDTTETPPHEAAQLIITSLVERGLVQVE